MGIGLAVILSVALVLKLQNHTPKASVAHDPDTIRYLPLGDSYTIGESVAEADRWPNQLVTRFAQNGKQLNIIANPSVTGYTTQDIIDRELPLVQQLKPDFDYIDRRQRLCPGSRRGYIRTAFRTHNFDHPEAVIQTRKYSTGDHS